MRVEDERSGIARLVRGDEARARELRANLAVFGRQCGDPEIRRLVADVLGGRQDVRAVVRSRAFNEVGSRRVANVERAISRLSDEQRASLFDPERPPTPEARLAALNPPKPDDDDFSQYSVLEQS
ncbi:MAG TPA: hypothetical protein VJX10_12020 [Pseudonocardiaceae bacterium]|nr:hypothetical protein [Pseudonocardiaceae bacterium]